MNESTKRPDVSDVVRLGIEGVTSSALVALAAHGPGVAALVALGEPAAAAVLADLARRGVARVFGVVLAEGGLTPEQIVGRLASSVEGQRLLARAVDLARTATYDDRLRALGRCLLAGASDGALIELELLLVGAVAALEERHMRLLRVLSELDGTLNDQNQPATAFPLEALGKADGALTPETVEVLIGPLQAQGVATARGSFLGGTGYGITALGRLLLTRAAAASEDRPG